MLNKLLQVGWLGSAVFALLLNAGCASKRGGGGCSGGCCRGQSLDGGAPPAVPAASPGDGTYLQQPPPPGLSTSPTVAAAPAPYGGQKTCPVTGEALGSMGAPVPVTVKGQTLYVCCQGCAGKVRKNPDAYLAKVVKERQGN